MKLARPAWLVQFLGEFQTLNVMKILVILVGNRIHFTIVCVSCPKHHGDEHEALQEEDVMWLDQ